MTLPNSDCRALEAALASAKVRGDELEGAVSKLEEEIVSLRDDLVGAEKDAEKAESKLGLEDDVRDLYAVALQVLAVIGISENDLDFVRHSVDPARLLGVVGPPPLPSKVEPPPLPFGVLDLSQPPDLPVENVIEWTEEQRAALDRVEKWGPYAHEGLDENFFALTGPGGSGKSTLVREIVKRYPHAVLTAMTGRAAVRLAECAGAGATTMHKVLYYPPQPGSDLRFTRLREPPSGFVVCDESSMMSPSVTSCHL